MTKGVSSRASITDYILQRVDNNRYVPISTEAFGIGKALLGILMILNAMAVRGPIKQKDVEAAQTKLAIYEGVKWLKDGLKKAVIMPALICIIYLVSKQIAKFISRNWPFP